MFSIDLQTSIQLQDLIIELKGSKLSLNSPKITEVKKELKKHLYQSSEKGRILYKIPAAKSLNILKQLTITGKLYLGDDLLIPDFFTTYPLFISLKKCSEGKTEISGNIELGTDRLLPLNNCQWASSGPPLWVLHGQSLKILKHSLPKQWLFKLFNSSTLELSQKETLDFLDECIDEEDPDCPPIKELSDKTPPFTTPPSTSLTSTSILTPIEPFPTLILSDRVGAFANLYFEYENYPLIQKQELSPNVLNIDKTSIYPRNLESENNFEVDLFETDFIKKNSNNTYYYCPIDKVSKSLLFLLEIGWKILDFKGRQILPHEEINLSLNMQSEKVILKGSIHYDSFKANIQEVTGAFNRRENFIQLNNNTVGLLPNSQEISTLSSITKKNIDSGTSSKEVIQDSLSIPRNSLSLLFEEHFSIQEDPEVKKLRENLNNFSSIKGVSPGISFTGSLRPYQQEGVNWLSFLYEYGFHGILADDMGLGKTVQLLAFLSLRTLTSPCLIVVPTSLIFNWQNEIKKFLPSISSYIFHGTNRNKEINFLQNCPIIITSYALVRRDLPLLQKISYECVILDEAQFIKNANSKISQAICCLNSRFRLSITGTPIENSLMELWSHFRFLQSELLGNQEHFSAEIQAAESDSRHLKIIQKKVHPFILRRTKEQVAKDLPEKIEQTVYVEMEPEQQTIYEHFLSNSRNNLIKKVSLDGAKKYKMEILEVILRLRQICCHPLLIGSILEDDSLMPSAKMDALLLDMESVVKEGGKALVYSQFTSMLKLINKEVNKRNWSSVYLDGATSNREKVVKKFQEDPDTSFFLISLKAGGVGLNLTAADYVFIFDPWWNEAAENQAIDRAHRIGRKQKVIAKRYITHETIENKIMQLKAKKRLLLNSIVEEGEDNLVASLSAEDLFELIN